MRDRLNWEREINELNLEHYYAVQTFLDDDELCKIWNIIEIAMNREFDVTELQ